VVVEVWSAVTPQPPTVSTLRGIGRRGGRPYHRRVLSAVLVVLLVAAFVVLGGLAFALVRFLLRSQY